MGKEIEFKIKMSREEAERVIQKIFDEYTYQAKIKTDRYWRSSTFTQLYGDKVPGKVVRMRSTTIVSDKMIKYFSKDRECNVADWFFYPTEKMFTAEEVDKWEDPDAEKHIFVTYKNRVTTDHGETNDEYEEEVSREQGDVIMKCLDALGDRYFNKIKRCLSFKPSNNWAINVDFDNVHNLYYFEIEYVMEDENPAMAVSPERALAELEGIVKEFGLNITDKDNRAWREIIQVQTAEGK